MAQQISIYEQMLLDSFRQNILENRISTATLKTMIEEDKLSVNQLKVIEELAPFLGGVANVAKSAANNLSQRVQGIKQNFQQGRQQAMTANNVKVFLGAVNNLTKAAQQLSASSGTDFTDLNNYLQKLTNYANGLVSSPQQQVQQQQQSQGTPQQQPTQIAQPQPSATTNTAAPMKPQATRPSKVRRPARPTSRIPQGPGNP
jgi:hypothetical protein